MRQSAESGKFDPFPCKPNSLNFHVQFTQRPRSSGRFMDMSLQIDGVALNFKELRSYRQTSTDYFTASLPANNIFDVPGPVTSCLVPHCDGIQSNRPETSGAVMGQRLHGSATTTHAIRAGKERSKATAQRASRSARPQPKTVAKSRKRAFATMCPMGPKAPAIDGLSILRRRAIVVAFRKHT